MLYVSMPRSSRALRFGFAWPERSLKVADRQARHSMMGWRVGFRAAQSRRNEPVQQLDDRRRCPAGVEIRFFTEHGCTDDIATEVSNRVVGIERSRSTVDRTLLP